MCLSRIVRVRQDMRNHHPLSVQFGEQIRETRNTLKLPPLAIQVSMGNVR
jgi:hypothetical protein